MTHPTLHYKPGLTMDQPVTVFLAAADWVALMTWVGTVDETPVRHLFTVIVPQLQAALYTPSSLKAAIAHAEEQNQHPVIEFLQHVGAMPRQPTAEDITEQRKCPICKRIIGSPTPPCFGCEDYNP